MSKKERKEERKGGAKNGVEGKRERNEVSEGEKGMRCKKERKEGGVRRRERNE